MYCRKCGNWITDDSNYCNYCGIETQKSKARERRRIPILLVVLSLALGITYLSGKYVYKAFFPEKLDYEKLSQSVVKIICYDASGTECKTGSGVVAMYDNVVVTNYHVVAGESFTFDIITDWGEAYPARSILAYNEDRDLALLELESGTPLTPLDIGDSRDLKRGDKVIAIGSPNGLLNTVSEGIISGFRASETGNFLQTTAAVSNGSSGGALLNSSGELIGITCGSLNAGENIGYAIPSNEIDKVLASGRANMNLIEFYNLREHDKPTYSAEEIFNHKEQYSGQKITAYGEVTDARAEGAYISANGSKIYVDFRYLKRETTAPAVGSTLYATGLFIDATDGAILYADYYATK